MGVENQGAGRESDADPGAGRQGASHPDCERREQAEPRMTPVIPSSHTPHLVPSLAPGRAVEPSREALRTQDLGGAEGARVQEGVVALQRSQQRVHPLQGGTQAEGALQVAEGGLGQQAGRPVPGSSALEGAHEEGDAFLLDQVSQP